MTSLAGRRSRQRLQLAALSLADARDAAINGSPGQRQAAERLLPAVLAAEQLAYRTIAACWAGERLDLGPFASLLRGTASCVESSGTPAPDVSAAPDLARADLLTISRLGCG